MAERVAQARFVSVDLQETEDNRALIEAIVADNPDIVANHFPGVVKLQSATQLVVKRASVEERLGRDWETHEFQMAIVTVAGNFTEWDEDEIVIAWEH
ncbi:MAG: MmoB/DmpM family protein [Austwickia sp.]|nr:MmoB/DmpM family protein [Actinomycetota bacterium]MCB1300221.1 MmoB/DmpM family protein [Tetrasphaera sp.]MCO5309056.1 MmoB/DmpM family protein [Austwickia sp.]